MAEIQKADPKARRNALALVVGGAVAGVVLISVATDLRPALTGWIEEDPDARLRIVLAVMTALAVGPLLAFALFMWRLGRRIIGAERYPPPSLRVVRDTPIAIGQAAVRRGNLLQWLAAAVGVAALVLALLLRRLGGLLDR